MLATLLALFLSVPAPAPSAIPQSPVCFACSVPGCPNSTFWVCHETPGETKVYAQSGATSTISTQSNDKTFAVGVIGANVHPASPKTWGTATSCDDIHGSC